MFIRLTRLYGVNMDIEYPILQNLNEVLSFEHLRHKAPIITEVKYKEINHGSIKIKESIGEIDELISIALKKESVQHQS